MPSIMKALGNSSTNPLLTQKQKDRRRRKEIVSSRPLLADTFRRNKRFPKLASKYYTRQNEEASQEKMSGSKAGLLGVVEAVLDNSL